MVHLYLLTSSFSFNLLDWIFALDYFTYAIALSTMRFIKYVMTKVLFIIGDKTHYQPVTISLYC